MRATSLRETPRRARGSSRVSRAASGVPSQTMSAMPATCGVGLSLFPVQTEGGHTSTLSCMQCGRVFLCPCSCVCKRVWCAPAWLARTVDSWYRDHRATGFVWYTFADVGGYRSFVLTYLRGRRREEVRIEGGSSLCCHSCLGYSCIKGRARGGMVVRYSYEQGGRSPLSTAAPDVTQLLHRRGPSLWCGDAAAPFFATPGSKTRPYHC